MLLLSCSPVRTVLPLQCTLSEAHFASFIAEFPDCPSWPLSLVSPALGCDVPCFHPGQTEHEQGIFFMQGSGGSSPVWWGLLGDPQLRGSS